MLIYGYYLQRHNSLVLTVFAEDFPLVGFIGWYMTILDFERDGGRGGGGEAGVTS